jgi:hypothetical protein
MENKEDRKKKRADKKESRAHDKSAKKAFREDHSILDRLKMKFGRKY